MKFIYLWKSSKTQAKLCFQSPQLQSQQLRHLGNIPHLLWSHVLNSVCNLEWDYIRWTLADGRLDQRSTDPKEEKAQAPPTEKSLSELFFWLQCQNCPSEKPLLTWSFSKKSNFSILTTNSEDSAPRDKVCLLRVKLPTEFLWLAKDRTSSCIPRSRARDLGP